MPALELTGPSTTGLGMRGSDQYHGLGTQVVDQNASVLVALL